MKKALEVRAVEAIQKGKWRLFTHPMSRLYQLAIHVRHKLYDRGWVAQKHVSLPVVSIGNLVAGGVGKTQVTLLLAEALKDVAILSRGYRSPVEKRNEPLVVSIKDHTAAECGDEAWLLASRLPHAQVIVNRNRFKSALAAEKLGARVLLLDDGMQHRGLYRNREIVVLGGSDPFGGEAFLPKGFLREDPKRLAQADLIVFVGKPTKQVKEKVAALAEGVPCVEMQVSVTEIYTSQGERVSSLERKKVGLFCGIGNPERFVKSVQEKGADVVASHYLPDHQTIGKETLARFATLCKEKGAEHLLCTEKDWVKLPSFAASSPLPVGWARVELEIIENREAWDRLTKEITLLAGMKR